MIFLLLYSIVLLLWSNGIFSYVPGNTKFSFRIYNEPFVETRGIVWKADGVIDFLEA